MSSETLHAREGIAILRGRRRRRETLLRGVWQTVRIVLAFVGAVMLARWSMW